MYPPLCCLGSRQISAVPLRHALMAVLTALDFKEEAPCPHDGVRMPIGLWDFGDRGAWIYLEMLPFAHSALPLTTLLAFRLSALLALPLEVVLIDSLDEHATADTPPDAPARVGYLRQRVYPDGQHQELRHPVADSLVGDTGFEGTVSEAPEHILHAMIQSHGMQCTPQLSVSHQGTARQRGLLLLLSATLGQPLQLRRRRSHFELELTSHDQTDTLVHFLSEAELRYLQKISPRFERLPL